MDDNEQRVQVKNMLDHLKGDRYCEYKSSPFLTSSFDADVFVFNFGETDQFTVDFRVLLEDGSLLTCEQNRSLLEILKCWICIQTHPDVTGGIFHSSSTAYHSTSRVIAIIDYFLIHSKHFKLSEYGLLNVTENDITELLTQLAISNEISTSIYQWPKRLNDYLVDEISKANKQCLDEIIEQNPFLNNDIPDEEDRMLSLSEKEIVYARALLWDRDCYKKHYLISKDGGTHRFSPRIDILAATIYPNTLRGKIRKPLPGELLLDRVPRYWKEYPAVRVRDDEDQASERQWMRYKSTIRTLGHLAEIGAPIPVNALKATNRSITQASLLLKSTKRYKTIPTTIVLDSLSKSIEFALNYGQELLESVASVIAAANKLNQSCFAYSAMHDIRPLLSPKIARLGVQVWHLGFHMCSVERSAVYSLTARPPSEEFFQRLRNNEGLYELLRAFFGSVQICVGALMARRQKELINLISGKALDNSKTFLIFFNGKSGLGDMREKELRPIPPIAVKLIEMIENFHSKLISIGVYSKNPNLFSYPDLHTGEPTILRSPKYNASIDVFCDYIQTPLNECGSRYYIRQHQLRRFFALMFFWGNSFGGMETLRWFLGHTDVEHLYHYITESVPGEILRATKAQFGSELIRSTPENVPQLANIVERHFGTRQFSLLDYDELEQYLEELLIEGVMEVTPIFLETSEGKTYRIAIKILPKEGAP